MIRELGPGHVAVLDTARPSFRAFLAILLRDGAAESWLALFALDLRSVAGEMAGNELLGAARVAAILEAEDVPVVTFPLSGREDIVTMVELVAPELIPELEVRSSAVTVVLVDQDGAGALTWDDFDELLT